MSVIGTLLLLLAFLYFHPSPLCKAAVLYYVKPTEPHNATCPSEPCYTLDEYVSYSTVFFVSNSIFIFLSGHHDLSYNLTVSGIENMVLEPFIEHSYVVIESELMPSLVFERASDIIIRGIVFQTVAIRFEYCTNVILSGLTAENTSVMLNNVFGEVNVSYFRGRKCCDHIPVALALMWTIAQYTVVLLHGLDILGSFNPGVSITGCAPGQIALTNSTFISATHSVHMNLDPSCNEISIDYEDTLFYNNTVGLAISVQASLSQEYMNTVAVTLHGVTFTENGNSINLNNVPMATISDCYLERSSGRGAIRAINSIVLFMGNVTFINNYITSAGGAMRLLGNSRILIPEPSNTHILFENNTADDTGGAIFFSSTDTYAIGYCRIFVEQTDFNEIVFNFSMNSAVNGGNAIYGAYLDGFPCYSPNRILVQNISRLFLKVAFFSPSFADDPSPITSDPLNICFCIEDGELANCSGPKLSVYPGQVFELPMTVHGDMNGLVKWSVFANVNPGDLSNEIQHSQCTNAERCTNLKYAILSNASSTVLVFSLTSFQSVDNYLRHFIIDLLECPLGFTLNSEHRCDCQKYLLQNIKNVTCDITEQSIERQGTTWIGILDSNTTWAFSSTCPFHYCNGSTIKIYINDTLLYEDIQCADNRSGVLCGGCRDNFSLALGSNRCLHGCNNNSLSLFIAFAVAGIALVFFIKILNLTVSQGTINGLIFYANIVGAEQTVLFFVRTHKGFLSVFIAWVNLDLGIETCFFDGMDAYAKAWLQFVFPVYVWAIALFIIILSHYSIRASKLFGSNSVPVLATLILLSYSKLLRAVISALSITDIQFLNGSTMSVWEKDGNIQYLTRKHIPLFVFAVAVLVLLWFPFTVTLVSIQWLHKGTHYRLVHWIIKLKSFLDAFTGPLKSTHHYWVGLLLLVRCSLLLVFYIYSVNGNGVAFISTIFATLIILAFLAATGSVYRNYFLTVLELSYILNLGILATGALYVQYVNNKGSQKALVATSVGIALLQFIAVVIYHAFVQLRKPLKKLKTKMIIVMSGKENPRNVSNLVIKSKPENYGSLDVTTHSERPLQRQSYQEMINFREPLLAYLSD